MFYLSRISFLANVLIFLFLLNLLLGPCIWTIEFLEIISPVINFFIVFFMLILSPFILSKFIWVDLNVTREKENNFNTYVGIFSFLPIEYQGSYIESRTSTNENSLIIHDSSVQIGIECGEHKKLGIGNIKYSNNCIEVVPNRDGKQGNSFLFDNKGKVDLILKFKCSLFFGFEIKKTIKNLSILKVKNSENTNFGFKFSKGNNLGKDERRINKYQRQKIYKHPKEGDKVRDYKLSSL